jgi:hypothetical protein
VKAILLRSFGWTIPLAVPAGTVLSALVPAVAAVLFLLLRGGDDRTEPPAGGDTATAGDGTSQPGGAVGRPRPRDRARVPGADLADPDGGTGGTRTYVTDTGNPVRDHRDNVAEPIAVPAPMPPSERNMSSVVTAAIYQQLAPVVRSCGVDLPADARGDDPVVHVTLMVDVTGEQLTTADATAVTSDIKGATADAVVACVRDRAAALTVPAKGEPDRSGYVVQYPIRLRK